MNLLFMWAHDIFFANERKLFLNLEKHFLKLKKEISEIRIDTYLWAIRIFKSRTSAGDAIKGGKVKLNEVNVKAAHAIKIGETYFISLGRGEKKIIEVSGLIDKRKSFEIAKEYYIDKTPIKIKIDRAEKAFLTFEVKREKGSGRPTKKDRRDLGKSGGWF